MSFYEQLTAIYGEDSILRDESMAAHTTFRIGGPADYFVIPESYEQLARGIKLCSEQKMPYFILGNGSNLLVGDKGFRGVIFQILKTMDEVTCEEAGDKLYVTAGAGIMLSRLAKEVSAKGYEGFEYATGIPGTLGGGITMDAGAYGGEIKDNILWADVMNKDGKVYRIDKEGLQLGYRHSIIMDEDLIVLAAGFEFTKGDQAEIDGRVLEYTTARKTKQPLEYPSAGSTFKRPMGYFAGKLIQDCNLKGYSVGDAEVSVKHSGFVINKGHATASDVMKLIGDVQAEVMRQFGVVLEMEVRTLGEF